MAPQYIILSAAKDLKVMLAPAAMGSPADAVLRTFDFAALRSG